MDQLEQTLLDIIDTLPVKPAGLHALITLDPADPQPYLLYKNPTYTLLLRPHSMFDPNVYDLFEVLMLANDEIIYKEDVFIEAAGKAAIRDVINAYNAREPQAA